MSKNLYEETDIFADKIQKNYIEDLEIKDYLFGAAATLGMGIAGLGAIFSGPIVGGVIGAIYSSITKDPDLYKNMAIGAGFGTALEIMAVPFLIMNAHKKIYHSDEL